ncbi:hypothetical protein Taro_048345, partial [Colocasia esculenta]|nr:hypothetical protein [Colocasia esculenta]
MDLISSSILGPLGERVFNAALEEYTLVSDAEEEIKSLAFTVSIIKGLLQDAERKQVEDAAIRNWLKGLKQVLFDAEDALDEIATDEALRRRDTNGTESVTGRAAKVRKIISSLFSVGAASTSHAAAHRIKDILKKFDKISRLKDSLGLRVLNGNSCSAIGTIRRRGQETSSVLPNDAHIIGRDNEKQMVEKLLLESGDGAEAASCEKNVHVTSVVGMGGAGKTTLVQHVYNNPAVESYFQPKMWVCVSNDFDLKRVTGKIMEAASISDKAKELWESSNWDVAQKGLRDRIEGKRFLLVLDDVWEEDPSKWDHLYNGAKGSKIIVTTRSRKVSNIAKGTPIVLQDLSSEDLWVIFKRYAFEGQNADNHTQLALVGRQIVDNLKGSPLAAKTIGRLLNANLDVRHWTNILKSKAWAEDFHAESMGREYFDDLLCTSLFERVGRESSVMHDLIHNLADSVSKDDYVRLEDNQIISETIRHVSIVGKSLEHTKLEELGKYENMRTLLFLRGYRSQLDPHLHNMFMKLQRLRVLGLCRVKIEELPASIGTLKHLRFLDLSHNLIGELPESLCNLHNLQVLNLVLCGPIRALPRNMSALINLRHLMTTNDELVSSIQGLGKLTALHELRFDCGRQPMKELADMGMLRRLEIRGLEKVESWEEAIDSRLDKKEHLDELTLRWDHGWFDVVINPGLEVVVLESLRPPSSIRRLRIYSYGGTRSPSWMEDPSWVTYSSFLETLELDGCVNWEVLPPLGQLRCLTSLEISGMRRVRRIESAFMGCCYALEGGVDKVVLQGFPSLQELEFRNMEEWEEWEVPHGNDGEGDQVVVSHPPPRQHHPPFLPRLRNLRIRNCPYLWRLPPLPPTLTKLQIQNVGLSKLPLWLPSSLTCSSLSFLEIEDCRNLTSLAGGLLRHPLPNLVRLIIRDCRGLVSLPETAFGHLTSLEELEKCPNFLWPSCVSVEDTLPPSLESIYIGEDSGRLMDQMMLAIAGSQKLTCLRKLKVVRGPRAIRRNLPSSLQELTIYNNDQLDGESLSTWLRGLTSLRRLSIRECPAMTSLPRAEALSHLTALGILEISCLKASRSFGGGIHCLASLETLEIEDCPELLDIIAADSSSSSSSLPRPAGLGTTRIRKLRIIRSSLQQMKTWLLQCPSLEDLSIGHCPQLIGFGGDDGGDVGGELEAALLTNQSGTLQHLEFWGCESLRSLPRNLRCLSALKSLRIVDCPQIQCFPVAGLPESLKTLEILGCPALQERCKEGEGSDWPLISLIPRLDV